MTEEHPLTSDPTVALTRELIRMDTQNWGNGKSSGEREAAEFLAERLRRLGYEPGVGGDHAQHGRVAPPAARQLAALELDLEQMQAAQPADLPVVRHGDARVPEMMIVIEALQRPVEAAAGERRRRRGTSRP